MGRQKFDGQDGYSCTMLRTPQALRCILSAMERHPHLQFDAELFAESLERMYEMRKSNWWRRRRLKKLVSRGFKESISCSGENTRVELHLGNITSPTEVAFSSDTIAFRLLDHGCRFEFSCIVNGPEHPLNYFEVCTGFELSLN